MELIASVLITIILVELYAWLPKISRWLVDREVSKLNEEERDRCHEEWCAALDALPNTLLQLLHALSFFGRAYRINVDHLETVCEEIDVLIEDHRRFTKAIRMAELTIAKGQEEARQKANDLKQQIRDQTGNMVRMSTYPESYRMTLESAGDLGDALMRSLDRMMELWGARLNQMNSMNLVVDGLLDSVATKRKQAVNLSRRRILPTNFPGLVKSIFDDLKAIKDTYEDDRWRDDPSRMEEFKRIAAIVEKLSVDADRIIEQS